MKRVLYIYEYRFNPVNSATMKVLQKVCEELGYELFSIEYSQEEPDRGLDKLENFIIKENIKYVIGYSLGGFMALCLNSDVKKLIINPVMKPYLDLPKFGGVADKTLYDYEYLEEWLNSGIDTPWVEQIEDVMGLFGDKDEKVDYYESFKKQHPLTYRFKSTHYPTEKGFTEEIKNKIKEFFN